MTTDDCGTFGHFRITIGVGSPELFANGRARFKRIRYLSIDFFLYLTLFMLSKRYGKLQPDGRTTNYQKNKRTIKSCLSGLM